MASRGVLVILYAQSAGKGLDLGLPKPCTNRIFVGNDQSEIQKTGVVVTAYIFFFLSLEPLSGRPISKITDRSTARDTVQFYRPWFKNKIRNPCFFLNFLFHPFTERLPWTIYGDFG